MFQAICQLPGYLKRALTLHVIAIFVLTTLFPIRYGYAQDLLNLPVPGAMVLPTPNFLPPLIKGITVYKDNPLKFDFIIHNGEKHLGGLTLEKESLKQIRYFLAALTVPENQMWVNLSPVEKNRMITDDFGVTDMGKDLLMQDYILKQLTASLIYPEDDLGKKFWERTYKRAYELLGTTNIPINTFNKIWIVPDVAVVYEYGNSVFVLESRMKVMLEEDYLASKSEIDRQRYGDAAVVPSDTERLSKETAQIVREVLIPEIEREVNEGENFVELRQIYQTLILAAWFKSHLKKSLLGQVYVDKAKTNGVNVDDPAVKDKIYAQYLKAYEKGVYNFVKDEYDPQSQEFASRTYFSGGFAGMAVSKILRIVSPDSPEARKDLAMMASNSQAGSIYKVAMLATESPEEENLVASVMLRSEKPSVQQIAGGDLAMVSLPSAGIPLSFTLRNELTQLIPQASKGELKQYQDWLNTRAKEIENELDNLTGPYQDIAQDRTDLNAELGDVRQLLGMVAARSEEFNKSTVQVDNAQIAKTEPVGGIDFDPALLTLQIKRDGKGAPLSEEGQDYSSISISGLYPVIVNITPVTDLPVLLGDASASPAAQPSI